MKKETVISILFVFAITSTVVAQKMKENNVPKAVKETFAKKYPEAKKITWEKEKGNYEANWGGKSGEDTSVVFTPFASFVEMVTVIPVNQLPATVAPFIKKKYNGAKITEAGKVTDASGKHMFEAEVKGKDIIFDEKGVFIKED